MRYVFIINPVAGKGNIQKELFEKINAYFLNKNADYAVYVTEYKGEATEIAVREVKSGKNIRFFACGGEGTCFEVLNGMIGYENAQLGVIPCGSANDFLKVFPDNSLFAEIENQVYGETVKMDVIKANENYCLNGCSVGMDAVVARDMNIFKKWPLVSGPLAYKLSILKTFMGKIGVKLKISVDGCRAFTARCLFAVIANAPFYGGGYMAAPDAVPYDGKLNFTLVNKISKLKIPGFLKKYEHGEHGKLDYCKLRDCSSMSFTSETAVPVNLDGEIIETKSMAFKIIKNAIEFVVPKGIKNLNVNKKLNVFDFT